MLYRLLDGPRAGHIVYVYEGITPTVRPGEEVLAGQQIATFYPGSSIEIGWSDATGAPLSHSVYTEGMVTQWGKRMWSFLHSLGGSHDVNHQFSALLRPGQWNRVVKRIGKIQSPAVPTAPSRYALPAGKQSHRRGG